MAGKPQREGESPKNPTPNSDQDTSLAPDMTARSARDRRMASLKAQSAALERQLEELRIKQAEVDAKLRRPEDPEATVKQHIRLLHEFNEIRDVAQGLIGLIAENRGVRVQDIYPEFGLDPDD